MTETVKISVGELWDKYTILLIKRERIKENVKLKYIELELSLLEKKMKKYLDSENTFLIDLKCVNETLWDIEDNIRLKESSKEFDDEFIELARNIYKTNDKRIKIKKKINDHFNSKIQEVKSYI